MSNTSSRLNLLEEKLDDLQRNTKFCVNNYDYHHKNNEFEILQNIQDILESSLQEGKQFISSMENFRSSINTAREKCNQADELLMNLGYKTETIDIAQNCAASKSFCEEQEAAKMLTVLEENKENSY